jgi:hypothetical protein
MTVHRRGHSSAAVRRWPFIALGVAVALGCRETTGPTPAAATLGRLEIRVTGLAPGAPGGSASVTRIDISGQPTLSLGISNQGPTNSAVVVSVAMGRYTITYTPPTGYTLPAGATRVQTVDVNMAGAGARVNFDVEFRGTVAPPMGFLGIDVEFETGPYPAGAGSVSILRTDITGQSPLTLDIPNESTEGYYAVAQVPIGAYSITYSPPDGYKVPAGYAAVQTAVVGDSKQTLWVTFVAIYAPTMSLGNSENTGSAVLPGPRAISVVQVVPFDASADRSADRHAGRRISGP